MKLFETFAGYGSQSMALKKYNIKFDSVGISEIDINAIIAYYAVHGKEQSNFDYPNKDTMIKTLKDVNVGWDFKKNKSMIPKNLDKLKLLYKSHVLSKNYGDISKINPATLPDIDLFTYSFPCQDISISGKLKGLNEGSGTRSSLLWECKKVIDLKRPKYLMMENVKNLVGKQYLPAFVKWLDLLKELGYNNYWKVINAKNCGIPQNRQRVFCVSILKEHDNKSFEFYEDFDSGVRLKDILEETVDEKYYLSKDMVNKFIEKSPELGYINQDTQASKVISENNEFQTLCAGTHGYANGYIKQGIDKSTNNTSKVEISNCITSREDRGISNREKEGAAVIEACRIVGRNPDNPKSRESGLPTVQMVEVSRNKEIMNTLTTVRKDTMILQRSRGFNKGGIKSNCPSITTSSFQENNFVLNYRIRKLTPRECFRLMGVSDSDIDKIQSIGISNSQQYKMAGNSIVVHCMRFFNKL